jgi:hypothetical protein
MRRLLVTVGALAVLLLGAGPALADPPVEVDGQVTDTVGALGADGPLVRAALDRVRTADGIDVFVVLVAGFDAPDGTDWAAATASRSELEDSDMLVAIDVTGGSYEWWIGDSFDLPASDVKDVLVSEVEPLLATGAWADAVITLTDGLTSETGTFLGGSADVEPWSGTTTVVVCGIVLVTLGGTHLLFRRRTAAPAAQ